MNLHKAIRLSVIFSLSIFKFLNIFPGFNLSSESSTIRVGNGGSSASFYLSKNVSGFNGTFRRGSNGTISNGTSKTIAFANGILDDNGVRSRTTSTYEPGGTYELTLGANQTLVGRPGQVTQNVKISGAGAKIEGQPTFDSALVFDENATAYFGLQSRLNQNIQFYSSGLTNTVFLNDDLKLADDVTIVNDGTIDVNGKSFWFGGKTLTLANTIHWANAGDINLSGRINFGGTWYVNDETNINGHGNIIDCSTGGVFDIAASTTLYLTDVTLKSIQDSTFIFRGVGSTIRLSKATLHFHENVTHDQGMIYVDGPSTVFIPR